MMKTMRKNTMPQNTDPESPADSGRELTIHLGLRWGDMDAYGHINNVQFVRLLEEARVRLLGSPTKSVAENAAEDDVAVQLFSKAGSDTSSVVAKQTLEYLAQLEYRTAPVAVFMSVSRIGGASFDLAYIIAEPDKSVVYIKAETTVVFVNRSTGRPRRITEDEREILRGLLSGSVKFRR